MTDEPPKHDYEFKRRHPDGRTSTLVGYQTRAASPEQAMEALRLYMGYTAKQGWFAVEMAANDDE